MKAGETIRWESVNRLVYGVLVEDRGEGNWLVVLKTGHHVVVNEKSFK